MNETNDNSNISVTESYTCPKCNGVGYSEYTFTDKSLHRFPCHTCDSSGQMPALGIEDILDRIKGRKPRTLRSKAPDHYGKCGAQSRRAYYVWRMARFHGGADVTMPMSAMSCVDRNDPCLTILDDLANSVAKIVYGTDLAAANRWGQALGFSNQLLPGLPSSAYEGGPVHDGKDEFTNQMMQQERGAA